MPDIFTSIDPQYAKFTLPFWVDLASVIAGALFGGLSASEKKLDIVGAVGLSLLCALGGGLIRDIIMQKGTVFMLDTPYAVPAAIISGLVAYLFSNLLFKVEQLMNVVDILSIALFAVSGTEKAIFCGLGPVEAILMGVLTGVGGGMLRDVFLGEVPRIFKPSSFYALCAFSTSLFYYVLVYVGVVKIVSVFVAIIACCTLRWASLHFNLKTPDNPDFSDAVTNFVKKLFGR